MNVTDAISGKLIRRSSNSFKIAKNAAFELSVSKMVSTSNKSAPPWIKPRACS